MEALIKSPVLLDQVLDLGGLAVPERAIPKPLQKESLGRSHSMVLPRNADSGTQPADEGKRNASSPSEPADGLESIGRNDVAVAEAVTLAERLAAVKEAEERAFAEASDRGLEEGRRAAAAECAELLDQIKQLNERASDALPLLLAEAHDLIASVVFEAVCKILGRELVTPDGCTAVIEQVVGRVAKESILTIRIAPADYDRLKNALANGAVAEPVRRMLEMPIEPSAEVGLGGCVLTLKAGTLDGRIETQFRNFAQTLKDVASDK